MNCNSIIKDGKLSRSKIKLTNIQLNKLKKRQQKISQKQY